MCRGSKYPSCSGQKSLDNSYKFDTLYLMDKRFRIIDVGSGSKLWTRALGAKIRHALNERLRKLPEGAVIIIDLDGIEIFDISFANEFFVKTALGIQGEHKGRFVVLENMEEHPRENLMNALEKEGQVMIERINNSWRLLGQISPTYQETLNAIARAKNPVSSTKLSTLLGVNPKAINERLKKLTALALIKREKGVSTAGREEYLYRMIA